MESIRFISSGQMAKKCGVSVRTIERVAEAYRIPGSKRTRVGKHWRFQETYAVFFKLVINPRTGAPQSVNSPGHVARQCRIELGRSLLEGRPSGQIKDGSMRLKKWIFQTRNRKNLLSVEKQISREIAPLIELYYLAEREGRRDVMAMFVPLV